MKTLCVTGVHSAELSYIEAIFVQAGMALPRPAQRNETLTMSRWHDQIQSRIQEIAGEQAPVELGRVWEQLASDLFVANLDQPVWGWSNVQSIGLLDFWQAFDPQIRFVLVTSSAQRFIANALESGEAMPTLSVLLEQWAAQHLQILQFYHRFPQKAVLVDIDHCMDSPAGLLKVCQQSWQLGLSEVHVSPRTEPVFPTLSRFLSESLIQTDGRWQSLQNELWASLTPIGTIREKPAQIDIVEAVHAYRDAKPQVTEPNISNQEFAPQCEALAAQLNDTQEQLKDVQEEADLLLAQLHQVQEELENYFLKYQDSKQELEVADMRWKRMLQRVPDYFDIESVEVKRIEGVGTETLRWRLKGLEAAGRKLPELELTSFIVGGIAGLEIPRQMGEHTVIQRWPAVAASDDALVIAWVGDEHADDKLTETLRQLGRSDWDLIQVIITALITALNTPAMLKRGDGVVVDDTLQALAALQSKLNQMPSVFRFDELALMREQVNHDYEHLWLNFRHVAIGTKRLLDFDFRISCANLRPNVFGQYPKLEFPETSGRAAFAEWFDESYDDFGAKLELRFALPESIDMQVWERLSSSDREFLEGLVKQIPAFLSELEASGVKLKRGWEDWHQLIREVYRLLKVGSDNLLLKAVSPKKPKRSTSRIKREVR